MDKQSDLHRRTDILLRTILLNPPLPVIERVLAITSRSVPGGHAMQKLARQEVLDVVLRYRGGEISAEECDMLVRMYLGELSS